MAADVIDEKSGLVHAEAGDELTPDLLARLVDSGVQQLPVLDIDHVSVGPYIRNTLAAERCNNREEALLDIYRVLRPGEPPNLDTAENLFQGLFFDSERYDLSPVGRVKIATYALSGMLATLAGVLYVAQYRQGKPDAGAGLELDAIAAVAIGGTSLAGGKGGLAGTLVGVLIFGLLGNILQLNNITSNLQLLLKGIIIVLAVLLQERDIRLLALRLRRRSHKTAPGTAVTGQGQMIPDGERSIRETAHEAP